jgi:glucosamine--fructose-6-phosphate aminotransferase (isomerizing)
MFEKLGQLQAETLIITDRSNPEALALGKCAVVLPFALPEIFTPIPYIIPAQLFTVCLAGQKGLNPDQPRTLSKVTKTM